MSPLLASALLAALALAQPAAIPIPSAAQPAPGGNCRDDQGSERCVEAQQRRMRESYGVRSIEEHQAAGDQVRRVFYVDGYGRDLILIAFVRPPRHDPTLWVHYPQREGEPRPAPLQAPVPQAAWDEIIARSADFDRSYVPRPGEFHLCMHAWIYTIEATGRRRGYEPAAIRRKTESACDEGPGAALAREVQRIALPLIPHCAALDPRQHRNAATMLDACRLLHGDRLAAAEVLNRAGAFRQVGGPDDARGIAGLFAQDPSIDWNGERYRDYGAGAGAFWAAHLTQASGWANLFFSSVDAQSAERVRLTGFLQRSVDGPNGRGNSLQQARVEQIWARDVNGEMRVERATVGPWEPYPPH